MSFDIVDMPSLGVHIPASFKRIAELQSLHRDAASGDLDIHNLYQIPFFALEARQVLSES
jgi:hypothetical protein